MCYENELSHNAELTTASSADSLEDVLVLLIVRNETASLAGDNVGLEDLIRREARMHGQDTVAAIRYLTT